MKTQVIYLELQDDLQTVQDKINWGKSERVLLVYPTTSPPLKRKIDLVHLERFTRSKGAQFAVVTNKSSILNFARELGISVFPNRRVAQLAEWDQPTPKTNDLKIEYSSEEEKETLKGRSTIPESPEWMKNKYFRYFLLSISILSILSVLLILLPSAVVQITPKTSLQTLELEIEIDPDATTYNLTGIVPADIIAFTIESERTMNTSGRLVTPNTYASGEVTFTNLTDQEVQIPAGTIIHAESEDTQKYRTTEDALLTAEAGSEVNVSVIAENPGETGNIQANTLTRLDGQLSFQASVINIEKISGGSNTSNRSPSDSDFEILKESLIEDMLILAQEEAAILTPSQDILASLNPHDFNIISESYSPSQKVPASELSLEMTIEYKFLIVRGSILNQMLEVIMDSHLKSGQTARTNSLVIEINTSENQSPKYLNVLILNVQRQIYEGPDGFFIAGLIKGKPVEDVVILLSDPINYGAEPTIISKPYWWPWLPFSPQRISIEVVD